ncbi:MAG: response regulator [Chthoniobacter sp.]
MRILIVDDEKNIRRALTLALESMDHEVACASNSALALAELKARPYDVVLLDLRLSQESGLDVLEEILRVAPQIAVVMVTAYASVETAVEAMRRGAFDYLPKPCTPDQVRQVLARVEKTRKLERRVAELESRLGTEGPEIDLTSQSVAMQKTLEVAFKAGG